MRWTATLVVLCVFVTAARGSFTPAAASRNAACIANVFSAPTTTTVPVPGGFTFGYVRSADLYDANTVLAYTYACCSSFGVQEFEYVAGSGIDATSPATAFTTFSVTAFVAAAEVFDADDDGVSDVIVVLGSSPYMAVSYRTSSRPVVHTAFAPLIDSLFDQPLAVFGDLDGDGLTDAVLMYSEATYYALSTGAAATPWLQVDLNLDSENMADAALGDVDADGVLDIVSLTHDPVLRIASLALAAGPVLSVGAQLSIDLGDFPNTASPLVLRSDAYFQSDSSLYRVVNTTQGTLTAELIAADVSGLASLAVADVDGNGELDLYFRASSFSTCNEVGVFLTDPADLALTPYQLMIGSRDSAALCGPVASFNAPMIANTPPGVLLNVDVEGSFFAYIDYTLHPDVPKLNVDASVVTRAVARDGTHCATGDIDGDGDQDLACYSTSARAAFWYAGDGAGRWTEAGALYAEDHDGGLPLFLAPLDDDADLDLVGLGNDFGSGNRQVFLVDNTDGLGTFSASEASFLAEAIAVADWNADGAADLLVGMATGDLSIAFATPGTPLATRYSALTMVASPSPPPSCCNTHHWWSPTGDDVNGDSFPDISVVERTYYSFTSACTLTVRLGDGTTAFAPPLSQPIGSCDNTYVLAVGDVNADGVPDYVVALDATVSVVTASLPTPASPLALNAPVALTINVGGGDVLSLALGDVSGDGLLDLVLVGAQLGVMVQASGGGLVARAPEAPSDFPTSALVVDGNGDGTLDILLSRSDYVAFLPVAARPGSVLTTTARPAFADAASATVPGLFFTPYPPAGTVCRTMPRTITCLRFLVASVSPCADAVIVLPPGNLTRCDVAPISVASPFRLVGSAPGSALACGSAGGTLFDVSSTLTLDSVDVVGTTSGAGATASTGIRVSGAGAALTVRSSTLSHCAPAALVSYVGAGIGGCIRVADGASASFVNTTFVAAHAPVSGGAVAAVGTGSTLTLASTTFAGCSAGSSGGAVFVDAGATATVVGRTTVTACSAGAAGGGMAVALGGSLSLAAPLSVAASTASQGGGLALLGGAAAVDVGGSGNPTLTLEGNTATAIGGGMYVGPGAVVGLPNTNVVLTANTAGSVGGGAFVAATASVDVAGLTAMGNTAAFGGGLGVAPSASVASGFGGSTTSLDLPRGAPLATALPATPAGLYNASYAHLYAAAVTVTANTAAAYGGGLYVCSTAVGVGSGTVTGNSVAGAAALATPGTDVMVCLPNPVPAPSSALPYLVASPALAGAKMATPPAALAVTLATPAVAPGTAMVGSVVARSADGTAVFDPSWRIEVTVGAVGAGVGLTLSGGVASGATDGAGLEMGLPPARFAAGSGGAGLPVETTVGLRLVGPTGTPDASGSEALVTVTLCPPGSGGVEGESGFTCAPCSADSFSDTTSADACVAIIPCPLLSFNNASEGARPVCVCTSGAYATTDGTCVACPSGASCAGGSAPPQALPGFFPVASGATPAFAQCLRPDACRGGDPALLCARGYEGYMCNECSASYFTDPGGRCTKCPEQDVAVFVFVLVVGLVVVAGGVVLAAVSQRGMDGGGGSESEGGGEEGDARVAAVVKVRRGKLPHTISLLLVALQIVGALAQARLGWGESSQSALNTLAYVAAPDITSLAAGCTVRSYYVRYAIAQSVPVGLALFAVVVAVVLKACVRSLGATSAMSLVRALLFMAAPLVYVPTAAAALPFFDCTLLPNNTYVLDADPGVECFSSTWWSTLPVAVAANVLYVLGTPVLVAVVLFRNRAVLFTPAVFAQYGSFYARFRRPFAAYELVNLTKKLAVVAATVFATQHQLVQLLVLVLALFGALVASLRFAPFYTPLYNTTDAAIHTALVIVVLLGIASYAERQPTAEGTDVVADKYGTYIDVGVIATLVALGVGGLYAVWRDVRSLAATRVSPHMVAYARRDHILSVLASEARDADPALADQLTTLISNADTGGRVGGPKPIPLRPLIDSPGAPTSSSSDSESDSSSSNGSAV